MLALGIRRGGVSARITTITAALGLLALGCTADERGSDIVGGLGPGGDGGADDGGEPPGDDGGDDGADPTGDDGGDDGDDPTGDDGGDDGDTGDPMPDVGDGGADPGEQPDISECSHWADVQAFFAELNTRRGQYGAEPPYGWHDRYKGIPWQGDGHNNVTFPVRFTWDDELAARALEEAQRLADGGQPAGARVAGQNGGSRDFWVDGLNTADWRITHAELPADWEGTYDNARPAALHVSNGSARMGFFYHDFGGDGPAINRMGIGAAMTPSCQVWWVMQFGP
jgi:hypothetical protein